MEWEKESVQGWIFGKGIQVVETDGVKRVLVKGQPYMSWRKGDEWAERMAIVQLNEMGVVRQEELADAFHVHVKTVSNYVAAFEREGSRGIRVEERGPKESWKLVPELRGKILWVVLKEGKRKYVEVQKALEDRWKKKVSLPSIRAVLMENGFVEERIGRKFEQRGRGCNGDSERPGRQEKIFTNRAKLFGSIGARAVQCILWGTAIRAAD